MPLRDYQRQAVDSIFSWFRLHPSVSENPILVMPTGTGKSHVIAGFTEDAVRGWPHTRIMVATHVKELVAQNTEKLRAACPTIPIGIYSAGLGRKEPQAKVVVGGVASMVKNIAAFGHRDILIIDECHLLSPSKEGMYAKLIAGLRETNPRLRIIGLSATPYRLGQGHLCEGGMFTHVCCNQADIRWFDFFIERGHLAPVVPWKPPVQADVSGVARRGGDFAIGALQQAVDVDHLTRACCESMIEKARGRKRWLVFAAGVEHADHVAECLQSMGVKARPVYAKLTKQERDATIAWFKSDSDEIRVVVNNNVLTTGFDHPPIDVIGMLRPTTSPSLWVQMVGRGMRPAPGKENCLVLDYAGNTARLGPVNDPVLPRKRGAKGDGAAPVKICPECECYNHTTARVCTVCGYEFPITPKLSADASGLEVLATDKTKTQDFEVTGVWKSPHQKAGKPTSLKVSYACGAQSFDEWVCFEHTGYARQMAEDWWARRASTPCPPSVDEAITRWDELAQPRMVRVFIGTKYPRVTEYLF